MAVTWHRHYPSYCVKLPELSRDRIELIQHSWEQIQRHATSGMQGKREGYFGERFYEILMTRYPPTKALFKNPQQQARAMTKMLSAAVGLLSKDLDAVVAQLKQLAARHHRYGTRPEHYDPVGECLVAAIAEALGNDLNAATVDAWLHLYSTICKVMIPITHEMCMRDSKSKVYAEE